MAQLSRWVEDSQPLAIGEIGLDAMAPVATHPRQRRLFEGQVDLARQAHLPILLHVRRCHDPVLDCLRRTAFPYGGIVHAFNGTVSQAHRYLDRGFRLGMGGVMTHDRAVRIRQMVSLLPEEALVLESDAPDLPPAGHQGERNEPCHLPLVVQALADLRRVSEDHIMASTRRNARRVLGLPDKD